MIAVIDYGVGNLFSLRSSFAAIGQEAVVTNNIEEIRRADRLLLPGVGAFQDAAEKLRASGMDKAVTEEAAKGKPLLGVCLGMQMLFEKSYEYGKHEGLSLLPGEICPLKPDISDNLKVPHIGWNGLHILGDSPLLKDIQEGDSVYYVHSFYAKGAGDAVKAASEYGVMVPGLVQQGNVFGAQFHPEKSGPVGLKMLKAFGEDSLC